MLMGMIEESSKGDSVKNIKLTDNNGYVSIQKHRIEDNWSVISVDRNKEEKRCTMSSEELLIVMSSYLLGKGGLPGI